MKVSLEIRFVNIARGVSDVTLRPGQEIRAIPVENVRFLDMLETLGNM